MGKDVMIKLNHVQKKYPDFSMDCSLTVYPGMITGLIGANGEGKSTTFKLILGLIGKEAGEMEVLGKKRECSNDGKQPEKEILQQTGVVLAETGFESYFTIHDIIPFLEDLYPEFEKDKFLQYCEEYKLPMNKKIKEFSTGMKRKLQIFAAITHKAKLLLLDEPTSGLDVVAREQMLTLLRGLDMERQHISRSYMGYLICHHSGSLPCRYVGIPTAVVSGLTLNMAFSIYLPYRFSAIYFSAMWTATAPSATAVTT